MHERPQPLLELLCRSCELGELRRWDIQHCPCLPRHRIVLHYDIRKPHDSGRTPHCFHLGYLEYEEWLHAGLADTFCAERGLTSADIEAAGGAFLVILVFLVIVNVAAQGLALGLRRPLLLRVVPCCAILLQSTISIAGI